MAQTDQNKAEEEPKSVAPTPKVETPAPKADPKDKPAPPPKRYLVLLWIGIANEAGDGWKKEWQPGPKPVEFPDYVRPVDIQHWREVGAIELYKEPAPKEKP